MKKGKDFWGPPVWIMFHILCIVLKSGNIKDLIRFMELLSKLIPCDYCKMNLIKKLKAYPPQPYMTSPEKAFFYSYMIHDLANQHITSHTKETKTSPPFDNAFGYYMSLSQDPKYWGPPIWTSIHIFAATLTPENAEYYKEFLFLLVKLLPNEQSRKTLLTILNKHDIDSYLRSNHDAFYYSFKIHDIVNKQHHKKSPLFEDVKSFYFSALGEECNDCKV